MKSIRKVTAIIITICLLCPILVFANESTGNQLFSDVSESDWFYSYVKNVNEKNFVEPIDYNTFEPNVPITRAVFLAAIAKLSGEDMSTFTKSSFSDIKAADWHAPFIEWAYQNGIASGTDSNTFSPDASITREQAAAFIHRFLNKNDFIISTEKSTFKDAESISSYAELSVTICQNAGILKGYKNSVFNPDGLITRAEAATVITRLEEYINNRKKNRILNEEDQKKIQTAIKALDMPIKEGMNLAKDIYTVAFSKSLAVTGNAESVLNYVFADLSADVIKKETVILIETIVNGLYGGTESLEIPQKYFGEKKENITSADFITGDIIAFQNNDDAYMYIYDGTRFSKLDYEVIKEDFDSVLEKALLSKRFVVLRPSYGLPNINPSLPYKEEKLNKDQEAVVTAAENYLLRGYRIQYADTRLVPSGEFRWQAGVKAPEDYTADEWGFINCAAFATDVHRYAIGWSSDMTTTWQLITLPTYNYKPTGKETESERQEIEKIFTDNLIPSDIICFIRNSGNGHAMLYVGNGNIIHSTGSTYNYTKGIENYEPSIRYMQLKDLFSPASGESNYVFGGKISDIAIIRPLTLWNGLLPESSVNRVENMKGIVAEKLSSHKSGMTVNPGDEMTFTFSIFNTNDYEVNLPVSDVVPTNTTYLSGAEKVDGKNLYWNITIPAGETREVSYTVKVNKTIDTKNTVVESTEGKVGNVPTNCIATQIVRTLTDNEQEKLVKAMENFTFTSDNPVENINTIYKKAFSVSNILPAKTTDDIKNGIFVERKEKAGTYTLKKDGALSLSVVPSLFGGRTVYSSTGDKTVIANAYEYKVQGTYYRTRLVKEQNLMVGDIIVRYDKESSVFYLYTGSELIDLSTGEKVADTKACLDSLLASQLYFAVVRPSALMK